MLQIFCRTPSHSLLLQTLAWQHKQHQLCYRWSFSAYIKDHASLIRHWLILLYYNEDTVFCICIHKSFCSAGKGLQWQEQIPSCFELVGLRPPDTGGMLANTFLTTTLKNPLKLNGDIAPVGEHNAVMWKLWIICGQNALGMLRKAHLEEEVCNFFLDRREEI